MYRPGPRGSVLGQKQRASPQIGRARCSSEIPRGSAPTASTRLMTAKTGIPTAATGKAPFQWGLHADAHAAGRRGCPQKPPWVSAWTDTGFSKSSRAGSHPTFLLEAQLISPLATAPFPAGEQQPAWDVCRFLKPSEKVTPSPSSPAGIWEHLCPKLKMTTTLPKPF